jgi:hypothetical protein
MRKIQFNFNEHNQSLESLESYYDEVKAAIDLKYSKANPYYTADFQMMTDSEVESERDENYMELSREASMSILAFVESLFRTDFIIRCELKKSDKLSIRYRHTYNPAKRIYTYSYNDVVLDGWADFRPEEKDLINELKEANNYRNWLAHGRYWQFKDNPAKYKIEKIRNLAHRIQAVFGSELKSVPKIGEKL